MVKARRRLTRCRRCRLRRTVAPVRATSRARPVVGAITGVGGLAPRAGGGTVRDPVKAHREVGVDSDSDLGLGPDQGLVLGLVVAVVVVAVAMATVPVGMDLVRGMVAREVWAEEEVVVVAIRTFGVDGSRGSGAIMAKSPMARW